MSKVSLLGTLSAVGGLFVPLFLLGILVLPPQASAQGTYECIWVDAAGSGVCAARGKNCAAGYIPGDCSKLNRTQCNSVRECTSDRGSCKWDTGPPLQAISACKTDFYPAKKGSDTSPRCECVPPGDPDIWPGGLCSGSSCPSVSTTCEVKTAVGTIPTCDLNAFARWFVGWAIGIGGGIAFLLIILAGFRILSSGGNPDQIKAGKEQLTAAITGLLFIVFSVFLLQLIGVEILHLPGFGK